MPRPCVHIPRHSLYAFTVIPLLMHRHSLYAFTVIPAQAGIQACRLHLTGQFFQQWTGLASSGWLCAGACGIVITISLRDAVACGQIRRNSECRAVCTDSPSFGMPEPAVRFTVIPHSFTVILLLMHGHSLYSFTVIPAQAGIQACRLHLTNRPVFPAADTVLPKC